MKKASVINLLIITPETLARQQYNALLSASTRYRFNIQFVSTIQETQAQLETFRPHCVLMDVELDAEQTTIFLQDLKRSKAYRKFPIIWITAVNEAKFISKAIKLGVQDVLIKEELSAELMINTIVQLVKNNQLIEQLKGQRKTLLDKNKELSEYKKYLEMRVMSRTAELKDSYEQLVEEMTLRKKIEEQLSSRNKELDTFVYKASHDLRGPLASLIGVTNIARLDLKEPISVKYMEMINESAQKLNFTLSNLLEVTKIKYTDAQIKQVNFQNLVTQTVEGFKARMEAEAILFKSSIVQTKDFFSDPYLLSILLHNLLDNATNYKTDHTAAFISVDIVEKDNTMEITVTDNGQGIEKEVQTKVFDMFFRHNMQAKGSGLGLYIVKNCVEKLNGTLTLLSEPEIGTEVKILLPNLKSN
jgi:signal transduction histidine kinase